MAILRSRFNSTIVPVTHEKWNLENAILADVSHGKACSVVFWSDTGDITDQIYEKLIDHEIYNHIKLSALATYYIEVEKSKIKELLDIVEKIDSINLKEGKSY